jgi:hypothetical protein
MRCWALVILLAVLACGAPNSPPIAPQATEKKPEIKPKDQFFTGSVTAIDDASITVNRVVLGKNSATTTFQLTPDTRFEGGQPRIGSQVTVRYVSFEDGKRAVHIILRRSPK